jgi:hypothetical protein
MPKGVYQRKPRPPKQYPAEMVRQVSELYASGMTIEEVAEVIGSTFKVVWRLMGNHGIPRRVAAKRDQRGEKNSYWKGDAAGYAAFHKRLDALHGKAKRCDVCGADDPDKQYDWANLTGRYEDTSDYKRMCRSCHWKHDGILSNLGEYACIPPQERRQSL